MKNRSLNILLALLPLVSTAAFVAGSVPARADDTAQPLPFHTIEGVGGGAITPIAILVNPASGNDGLGKPSFAISYVGLGQKSLSALTATETLFQRVEIGFGADQLGLGTLPSAIRTATESESNPGGIDIGKSSVWLYNYNLRVLAVKETPNVPAIALGVQYKDNTDIKSINSTLGGALSSIGYKDNTGFDYTLTATKVFPLPEKQAIILTAGGRESKAANLGFLGFGNSYKTTFEGNVVYLPAPKWVLAYEFRQKTNPFTGKIADGQGGYLIGNENNWNAFDASYIVSNHATIVVGYGQFGTLANATANNNYWLQLKENL
jgi:hypothetical protein